MLICHLFLSRGMDPIMLTAACGLVAGIGGYMLGGAFFTATWKLIARNKYNELQRVMPGLDAQRKGMNV